MSSSSSSEDEKERKRQLQEAVSGVDLPSISSTKRQKLSKRTDEQKNTSGLLASVETQKFIAKKLSILLDKQYEVVTSCTDSRLPISSSQVSCIKLLRESTQRISLTPPPLEQVAQKRPKAKITDDTSSESETENLRLKEAAVTFIRIKEQ